MSAESRREVLANPTYKSVGVDVLALGGVTQETTRICARLFVPPQEVEIAGVCVMQLKMSRD